MLKISFEHPSMDFIINLSPSPWRSEKHDIILIVVDRFSKFVRYISYIKNIDAEMLADVFWDSIGGLFGPPRSIISDRGSVFTSSYWAAMCFRSGMTRRLSTAFHPQTDGQTERQNQVLEQYLRCFCEENQTNWAQLLPFAQFAHNRAVHSSIKCSPFRAAFGYDPEIDFQMEGEPKTGEVPSITERLASLTDLRERLASHLVEAAAYQTKYYNLTHKERTYVIGDFVWLSTRNLRQRRPCKKLSDKFIGPLKIIDAVGSQAYRLELPDSYRIHDVFHVSLLEPYKQRPGTGLTQVLPPPELINDEEEWEIEEVIEKQARNQRIEYLVK